MPFDTGVHAVIEFRKTNRRFIEIHPTDARMHGFLKGIAARAGQVTGERTNSFVSVAVNRLIRIRFYNSAELCHVTTASRVYS